MNLFIEFMTYKIIRKQKKTTYNFIVFIFDKHIFRYQKSLNRQVIQKFEKVKQFEYSKKGPVIAILIIIDSRNKKRQ